MPESARKCFDFNNIGLAINNEITRSAPIIYKPEGERIAQKLWDETMVELSFAGAQDIISGLEK